MTPTLIEKARLGSRLAARNLLFHFAVRVHDTDASEDPQISRLLLEYLADAFDHYLRGKDTLESSLGLKKRRHRGMLKPFRADIVKEMYEAERYKNPKGAIARTARALNLTKKQVEHFLYRYRDT